MLCLTIAETTSSSLGVSPNFRLFTSSCVFLSSASKVGTASVPAQHAPLITVRMPSINNSVAALFRRTPRAPSSMASMISSVSISAEKRMVLVMDPEPLTAAKASRPPRGDISAFGCGGILRSNSKMSGFSSSTRFMASAT